MNDVGLGIFAFLVELAGIHQLAVFFENLDQTMKSILPVVGLIVCVYGLLQCFLGYKLFKFWCGIVGLFAGVLIGDAIATSGVLTNTPGAALLGFLIILFLGLIGAFVAYRAYMVGLFLYAFAAAFSVIFYIVFLTFGSPLAGMLIGMIAGVAMGVVAVVFKRFWIIVATSVYGGISICTGMMMVIISVELGWFFILPPVFAIAGFIVQEKTVKKYKKPAAETAAAPGYTPEVAADSPQVQPLSTPPAETYEATETNHINPVHPLQAPNQAPPQVSAAPENHPQPPQE